MVSVIIPTHKRADLLIYELEKIFQQKNVEIEVVVVNDIEKSDETDKIKTLFPDIVYIKSNKIQGPSEKHKMGLSISKGEYVYMPDDDDYLIDDYFFEKAISVFEGEKNISLVSGNVKIRYEDDNHKELKSVCKPLNVSGRIEGLKYLQEFQNKLDKPASTVSTLFRRESIDCNMIEMSDSSIYMQALFNGDAFILDDVVAVYRVQKSKGKSLTSSASIEFIKNVLKQKEQFYFRAKGVLPRPKDFWACHFSMTYSLLSQKPNCRKERLQLLLWGWYHTHGSLKMTIFLIKESVKLICYNE